MEHTHEEYLIQVPIQGTNISVMQPATVDQVMNSFMHAGQAETINVDMSTPLFILTPGAPVTIQIPNNEDTIPVAPVIEIPLQSDILNEVCESFQQKETIQYSEIRAERIICHHTNEIQVIMHHNPFEHSFLWIKNALLQSDTLKSKQWLNK